MSGTFSNVGTNFSFNGAQAKGAADPTDAQDLVTLNYADTHYAGTGDVNVATDPIWNARGDLAVGTASDLATRLAVGTVDGQVLTVGTAQPTGIYWATPTGGIPTDGWVASSGWTYSSADSPTFVIATSSDLSGTIPVGARLKLTQTTVKYFIVTAIDATTITVYGGTDYTLANAAISAPYYSLMKAPLGFPLDPAKWTVETSSSGGNPAKATATASVWYGDTGLSPTGPSISIPIGCWRVYYEAYIGIIHSGSTGPEVRSTLSTASNSESDSTMTAVSFVTGPSTLTGARNTIHAERTLTLASKTTYYLNLMSPNGATITSIFFNGTVRPILIRAVCAYL